MLKIIIQNKANLPQKHIRFIKWKMYKLKTRFQHLLYTEIHIDTEGQDPCIYYVNIKLGIPGNDIIIKNKSKELGQIFKKSTNAAHRYLSKTKLVPSR